MVEGALERAVNGHLATARGPEEYDRQGLHTMLLLQYLVQADAVLDAEATPDVDKVLAAVRLAGREAFGRKKEYLLDFARTIGVPDVYEQVLSQVMLAVLDEKWKDHLYDLDQLRHAIQYRAYGQRDPLVEYKREAFEMFEDLVRDIQGTFTERFLKIQVNAEAPRQAPPPRRPPPTPAPRADDGASDLMPGAAPSRPAPVPPPAPSLAAAPDVRVGGLPRRPAAQFSGEVGRNDPCPCGSGKKYKKCHGAGQ